MSSWTLYLCWLKILPYWPIISAHQSLFLIVCQWGVPIHWWCTHLCWICAGFDIQKSMQRLYFLGLTGRTSISTTEFMGGILNIVYERSRNGNQCRNLTRVRHYVKRFPKQTDRNSLKLLSGQWWTALPQLHSFIIWGYGGVQFDFDLQMWVVRTRPHSGCLEVQDWPMDWRCWGVGLDHALDLWGCRTEYSGGTRV